MTVTLGVDLALSHERLSRASPDLMRTFLTTGDIARQRVESFS